MTRFVNTYWRPASSEPKCYYIWVKTARIHCLSRIARDRIWHSPNYTRFPPKIVCSKARTMDEKRAESTFAAKECMIRSVNLIWPFNFDRLMTVLGVLVFSQFIWWVRIVTRDVMKAKPICVSFAPRIIWRNALAKCIINVNNLSPLITHYLRSCTYGTRTFCHKM